MLFFGASWSRLAAEYERHIRWIAACRRERSGARPGRSSHAVCGVRIRRGSAEGVLVISVCASPISVACTREVAAVRRIGCAGLLMVVRSVRRCGHAECVVVIILSLSHAVRATAVGMRCDGVCVRRASQRRAVVRVVAARVRVVILRLPYPTCRAARVEEQYRIICRRVADIAADV